MDYREQIAWGEFNTAVKAAQAALEESGDLEVFDAAIRAAKGIYAKQIQYFRDDARRMRMMKDFLKKRKQR